MLVDVYKIYQLAIVSSGKFESRIKAYIKNTVAFVRMRKYVL